MKRFRSRTPVTQLRQYPPYEFEGANLVPSTDPPEAHQQWTSAVVYPPKFSDSGYELRSFGSMTDMSSAGEKASRYVYKPTESYHVYPNPTLADPKNWLGTCLWFPNSGSDKYHMYPLNRLIPKIVSFNSIPNFDSNYVEISNAMSKNIINTKAYDPFNEVPSLWFLIVDLLLLPALAKSAFTGVNAMFKCIASGPPGASAKVLSDLFLLERFGIEATTRDIFDIIKTIQGWPTLVAKMKESSSGFIYSRKFPPYVKRMPERKILLPLYGHVYTVIIRETYETVSQFRYQNIGPELTNLYSRIALFMDAFGIIDPNVIWDQIPFSFVVDWFLGIGNWLSDNKPRAYPTTFNIVDSLFGCQRKFEYILVSEGVKASPIESYIPNGQYTPWSVQQSLLLCTEVYYVRAIAPHMVNTNHITHVRSGLTGHWQIAAALAGQRLHKFGRVKSYARRRINIAMNSFDKAFGVAELQKLAYMRHREPKKVKLPPHNRNH